MELDIYHSTEVKTVKSSGPLPAVVLLPLLVSNFFKMNFTGLGGKPNTSPFVLGLCLWVLWIVFFFSNFLCLWKWEMSNHDECYKRGKKIQSVLGKTWDEKNSNLFCQLFWDRENLQSAKHYMTCQVRWEIFAIPSDNLHRKREN